MGVRRSAMVILTTTFLLLTFAALTAIGPATGGVRAGPDSDTQAAQVIPYEAPRADLISFGPLNDLGEAAVTGGPGAVLPDAHVLLVNLKSAHQDYVLAEPDGSFTAEIFAPPGSPIMVKHGPDHRYWQDVEQGGKGSLSLFPSTTINIPHEHSAGPDALPFAAAGGIDAREVPPPATVGAGWSMTGTVGPVDNLHPGDSIHVEATVRLYSQEIISTTDVSTITLQIDEMTRWLMLFDDAGQPLPYVNQPGSSRLTPTGFPILDNTRPTLWNRVEMQPVDWQFAGGHMVEGHLTMNLFLNEEMPPGIYRPLLQLRFGGVPSGNNWRAALLSWMAGLPSFVFDSLGAALPPLEVQALPEATVDRPDSSHSQRLIWYLQMHNATLGIRGSGAREDRGIFEPASFVVTQGAPYVLPPVDANSGDPADYRLEPYLPMISYGREALPGPPLIPFRLPGGQLCVIVHEPDGQRQDLGCEPFAQSISGNKSTALGEGLNDGAIEVSEYYGLTTASERFDASFSQSGHHVVEMNGWVEDVWGNRYQGGGTYDLFVAHPFDVDPGMLPGVPLAVGDPINPTLQLQPRLPARVNLTIQHFPYSDPGLMQAFAVEGWANRFGIFVPDSEPITLEEPGEYRIDLLARHSDPETGEMYVASATWGGIVMTPPDQAQLVAHGRRGSDNHSDIPSQWFLFCDPDFNPSDPPLVEGSTPHLINPYLNGDILWSYDIFINEIPECLGDALMMNVGIQDTVGSVENAITERYNNTLFPFGVALPGNFEERAQADSLPLFSSTSSGRAISLYPEDTDQIGYAYLSSQRPGVRVRETVSEDVQGSGYWRLDSMYDNQPGTGLEGDLPNDFKYQYVGAVYRDLESGLSEYLGQGSGWVHLPYDDPDGTRVMPPFAGPGNGGWPTEGGPLMTLKGEDIYIFIMPAGVRPGAILQVGDRFDFGGYLMPTLDSRVEVEVTAPSGRTRIVDGRANRIGYFYAPEDGFEVDEAGLWTATVRVWHDGQIGSGEQVNCDAANPFDPARPCPSGDVLGSAGGTYAFYAVSRSSPRLTVTSPVPGRLIFGEEVPPIEISGPIPAGMTDPILDYTISIPGFILEQGQADIADGTFSLTFDPQALHADFPNVDLTSRHGLTPGLSDTFSFGLLLTGQQDGTEVYSATTLTIQGDQVYVESGEDVVIFHDRYLPVLLKPD